MNKQAPDFTQEQYAQALKGIIGKAYTMGVTSTDLRALCEDALQTALADYYANKTYERDFMHNGLDTEGNIEVALIVESAKNRMVNILKRENGESRKVDKSITVDIPTVHHDHYFDHILVGESWKRNDGMYRIMEAVRSLQASEIIEGARKREIAKIKRGHEAAKIIGMIMNGLTEKQIFNELGKRVEFSRVMKVIREHVDEMEKMK